MILKLMQHRAILCQRNWSKHHATYVLRHSVPEIQPTDQWVNTLFSSAVTTKKWLLGVLKIMMELLTGHCHLKGHLFKTLMCDIPVVRVTN